ncbi:hypothetical protein C3007_04645 [Avibacterium gallinarum]|uniref:Asparagine synthase n=1 Tax=Avibacterium gallinarum TaxID=755 RepID=A0A379AXF8_AVIGA|nr:hypothetical protein [Avibacterium gallinarum]POY44603.1 hypothetical protein C3007_04645 [Avibacterium gallinarum]TDP30393.1 hypothetical protein EV689_101424 [Avibacterium gallinarum]SUB26893.1 Uncharacterised protein [Avibacterium gallinarum]
MSKLRFIPYSDSRVDFVITTKNNEYIKNTLVALGASEIKKIGYTAYVWNNQLGDRFLSGLGILDSDFYIGPRRINSLPNKYGVGNYVFVDLSSHTALVQPDPFGMGVTYFSDCFISNRLHLLFLLINKVDIPLSLISTYNNGGFSYSLNTFDTPIQGVRLLPAGAAVKIIGGKIQTEQVYLRSDFQEKSPEEYWQLIRQGAQEIIDNVNILLDSGFPVIADLSGGRDSRVVFGALVASGRIRDVVFNTIANPSTPGLTTDLNIASGLVKQYGGSYQNRPVPIGYSVYTPDQNMERRRSQVFGTYHWITPSDIRPMYSLSRIPCIRMLGGGGELYREYWRTMLFNTADPTVLSTDSYLSNLLYEFKDKRFGNEFVPGYINSLLETFNTLPGNTIGHKLDAHYLNFRNRFHFGQRQSIHESMYIINVATSPSLLEASRSLPLSEQVTGRVLFDVIRCFDDKLAYFEFDSPTDERIFNSIYHLPRSNHDIIKVSPAIDIVQNIEETRGYQRPTVPKVSEWDFDKILDREILDSIDILNSRKTELSLVLNDELNELILWAKKHSPRNFSSLASRLRSLADYSQI